MEDLDEDQHKALDLIQSGKNVFITGPPGTGKTFTLNHIISELKENERSFEVTAMTGSAASLITGKTLHSCLGIGLADAEDLSKLMCKKSLELKRLQTLIIDEVSMLGKDLMERISKGLSKLRRSSSPFGGIQVIFSGDFAQLPPVNDEFCIVSDVWENLNLNIIQLKHSYRQDCDNNFLEILNRVRFGECNDDDFRELRTRYNVLTQETNNVKATKLYPINTSVDFINSKAMCALIKLGAEHKRYKADLAVVNTKTDMVVKVSDSKKEDLFKYSRIPEYLRLAVGSQILVTRNLCLTPPTYVINGTRGVVKELCEKEVVITLKNGLEYRVSQIITEVKVSENKIAKIVHIPLRLAYAITIHKSQGMTIDSIEIDLGSNVFTHGQAYTALSRARNLKSINFTKLEQNSFVCDPRVAEFYDND